MNNERSTFYEQFKDLSKNRLNKNFIEACDNGYLDLVKYLLTSPELKEHADINAHNDDGFRIACFRGHSETVKYLLTSPDLKEHADIHAEKDDGFACNYEHNNVLKYLIFDMDIEKTDKIQKHLKDSSNEQVENMFKIRDLNQSLKKDLSSDKANQKKNKL